MTRLVKKKGKRTKHIPQRTCVGCQAVSSKRDMVRLVRTEQGIVIDPTWKIPGRGVYLHNNRKCWEMGLTGAISRGLRIELTKDDRIQLHKHMQMLPVDDHHLNTLNGRIEQAEEISK